MKSSHEIPALGSAVAEQLAAALTAFRHQPIPDTTVNVAVNDLIDAVGLCVAARNSDYIQAIQNSLSPGGLCSAIGHGQQFDAAGAALINGTAIHGEDFDDTLEGAPIRVGAMVIPAVLAACEQHDRSGEDALFGIIAGLETICRINQVVPGAIHKAGFHPVGVLGAIGAAAGAGVALNLTPKQLAMAFGIAGSFSSGLGEFLTEGAWTKRLHPGWSAQSGYRAAMLAKSGFIGPRTIFEGPRNLFKVFGRDAPSRLDLIMRDIGRDFLMDKIAFKPYACGTMIHPYIDCMIELAESGVSDNEITRIDCEAAEGPVDRLWEPLEKKKKPPSGYAAKFSMPFGMAVGFIDRDAGLLQFTDQRAADPRVLSLASKIYYVVDPNNPYPNHYTGHIKATLANGKSIEIRRENMRGGQYAPLTRDELIKKFHSNIKYGNLNPEYGDDLLLLCTNLHAEPNLRKLASLHQAI